MILPKSGSSRASLDETRLICIQYVISKIIDQCVINLAEKINSALLTSNSYYNGFKAGFSTQEHITSVLTFIHNAISSNAERYILLFDFKKAFDNISREQLLLALTKRANLEG